MELGEFLFSFFEDRMLYIEINNINFDPVPINSAVPQDFVLSPMLFLIYIVDLSNSFDCRGCILFADDSTFVEVNLIAE